MLFATFSFFRFLYETEDALSSIFYSVSFILNEFEENISLSQISFSNDTEDALPSTFTSVYFNFRSHFLLFNTAPLPVPVPVPLPLPPFSFSPDVVSPRDARHRPPPP